jgi:hypothetical protein
MLGVLRGELSLLPGGELVIRVTDHAPDLCERWALLRDAPPLESGHRDLGAVGYLCFG